MENVRISWVWGEGDVGRVLFVTYRINNGDLQVDKMALWEHVDLLEGLELMLELRNAIASNLEIDKKDINILSYIDLFESSNCEF